MRLIDADALKEKWLDEMMRWSKQSDDYCDGSHWTDVYADFIKELNEAPTVDCIRISDINVEIDLITYAKYEEQEISDAATYLIGQKLSEIKGDMDAAEFARFVECQSVETIKLIRKLRKD